VFAKDWKKQPSQECKEGNWPWKGRSGGENSWKGKRKEGRGRRKVTLNLSRKTKKGIKKKKKPVPQDLFCTLRTGARGGTP